MAELESKAARLFRLESRESDLIHSLASANLSDQQKVLVKSLLETVDIEIARIRSSTGEAA
jgi:hypothetical protein